MAEVEVVGSSGLQAAGGPLVRALRRCAASGPPVRSFAAMEQETLALTEEQVERLQSAAAASTSTPPVTLSIPRFFKPRPQPRSLTALIEKEVTARRELAKTELALDEAALRQLWELLQAHALHEDDTLRINYDIFCQVGTRAREMYGKAVDPYFRPSTYARFAQDGDGCISATVFAAYLGARSSMHGLRLQLSLFDPADTGQLSEAQLQDFLKSVAAELPALAAMEPGFVDHYARITARKFLFFHGRNAAVRIRDLLTSPWMQELMELKDPELADPQVATNLIANWFSLQSAKRVYNTFMALDEDGNGLLSRSEFSQISNGSMSPLFIQRIFEEHVMRSRSVPRVGVNAQPGAHFRDEMDLIAFTDFVLAWDHRALPPAIKYFFPIMDLRKAGVLSPAELYTFFKEIHGMWVDMGEYADLSVHDVVDEIIDMVQPAKPPLITADDLLACGMSGIFFSMLSDVKQFYEYNNRETLMHQDDNE